MKIVIPGKPIAKKRPRFARRGKYVCTYNDQEKEEERIKLHIIGQSKGKKFKGPVAVSILFLMPRPKNHFGTGRNKDKLKETAPFFCATKPDIDNLEKMVFDCINQLLWTDDARVVESHCTKIYSDKPMTIIDIWQAEKRSWQLRSIWTVTLPVEEKEIERLND